MFFNTAIFTFMPQTGAFMKSKITLLAFSVLALALVFSCNKTSNPNQYSMKATIDGTPYEATNCVAKLVGSTMIINGVPNNATIPVMPYISININGWHEAVDTFKFDTTMHGGYAAYITNTATHTSQFGLVFINTFSATSVSGTFQFLCYDSTNVTDGTFIANRLQ